MSGVKDLPVAKIVRREDLTDDLMKLWLEPPAQFSGFEPGQYCTIGMDGEERPYSIVSVPHELPMVELFLELIPEKFQTPQSLTPKLWTLRAGDTVTMRPKAKGAFLLDETALFHGMIATVTGIAPFISMFRALQKNYYKTLRPDEAYFFVFQGASYQDEFGYFEELIALEEDRGLITYIPTVSRPMEERNKSWRGHTGRVNNLEVLIRYLVPRTQGIIYLCGNEGMIDDLGNAKETLEKPLGKLVKSGYRIKKEVFF